jgi:hypothetical protein
MIDRGRSVLEQSLHVRHSQRAMASSSLGRKGPGIHPSPVPRGPPRPAVRKRKIILANQHRAPRVGRLRLQFQ